MNNLMYSCNQMQTFIRVNYSMVGLFVYFTHAGSARCACANLCQSSRLPGWGMAGRQEHAYANELPVIEFWILVNKLAPFIALVYSN